MARPGITKQTVFEAANQIVGRGGEPTIEQIRGILGTGSNSTIAGFLREWRALQTNENAIPLTDDVPHEITGLIRGLWQRLLHQSNEKVTTIQASCDKDINEVKTAFNALIQEHNLLQQQYEQLKTEKHSLQGDKDALEQVVIQKDQSITALKAQNEGLSVQVSELKRLHKQVQENLEHYRESSREQRLQEQEKFNQQIQQAEFTIKQLRQENNLLIKDKLGLQYQVEKTTHENELLQKTKEQMSQKFDKLQDCFVALQKEQCDASIKAKHFEAEYGKLLERFGEENEQRLSLQNQVTALSAQVNIWKDQVDELKEQNKVLSQDKWEIAQEKAGLIVEVKKMQEIIR